MFRQATRVSVLASHPRRNHLFRRVQHGAVLDTQTFNSLLRGSANSGWENASQVGTVRQALCEVSMQVWGEMTAYGLRPDVTSYNLLMRACRRLKV